MLQEITKPILHILQTYSWHAQTEWLHYGLSESKTVELIINMNRYEVEKVQKENRELLISP